MSKVSIFLDRILWKRQNTLHVGGVKLQWNMPTRAIFVTRDLLKNSECIFISFQKTDCLVTNRFESNVLFCWLGSSLVCCTCIFIVALLLCMHADIHGTFCLLFTPKELRVSSFDYTYFRGRFLKFLPSSCRRFSNFLIKIYSLDQKHRTESLVYLVLKDWLIWIIYGHLWLWTC
jgi:hypothetical protein